MKRDDTHAFLVPFAVLSMATLACVALVVAIYVFCNVRI